ncbi:MAG: hypothetical protein H7249_14790 [Chitinophagaceae bacterium]|nr:hypothetical protein [Oligoflexus sp.]
MHGMLRSVLMVIVSTVLSVSGAQCLIAGIHRAPIIIPAKKLRDIADYPVKNYRLFKTDAQGVATPIPFQIDEVNKIGDYVMPDGPVPNAKTGDGVFSDADELSFMGDDVGEVVKPSKWPDNKVPENVFELKLSPPSGKEGLTEGAVYIAVFNQNAPALNDSKYVVFNLAAGEVVTSRYRYRFDKKNYLVVNGVEMIPPVKGASTQVAVPSTINVPLIDSSTFYAKADLKYFLTVQVNHRSVNSKLEAFKTGPIRTIVRVTFLYTFLKLNFEVGMYTEVSFFSNSVILPAIIYNPLDGIKSLNKGSGFYYGFALTESPRRYQFDTNMRPYQDVVDADANFLSFLKKDVPVEKDYWASLIGEDRMMYIMLKPSATMLQDKNVPYYFVSDKNGSDLKNRDNNLMKPILESPVNLGLYFDLTRFREGEHFMSFQLFFENKKDYKILDVFKSLDKWRARLTKVSGNQ